MASKVKPTVVAIVGPTGSGKTALSLYLGEKFAGEIVACDSRTVYRCMDIGTAKPTIAERKNLPHHMFDLIDPDQSFTVSAFASQAKTIIEETLSRKHLPIVCGGTGFYARALLEGLSMPDVSPHEDLRQSLNELADREGNPALLAKLQEIDPPTASRLNVNDRFRIIRALEVSIVTGKPFSQLATKVEPPYNTIWIGLTTNDRQVLYDNIDTRFDQQLKDGLIDEVKMLRQRYGDCPTLMKTVNYRQYIDFLQGQITEAEARQLAVRANCNLARKQLIWFRSHRHIEWFARDQLAEKELNAKVFDHIEKTLA